MTSPGELLRQHRNHRGLSQTRLAENAGCEHSYLSRLETGGRQPSRDTLEGIIRALDLDHEQADELRLAYGFRAASDLAVLAGEPELVRLALALRSSRLEPERADRLRAAIDNLAALV